MIYEGHVKKPLVSPATLEILGAGSAMAVPATETASGSVSNIGNGTLCANFT